MSSAVATVVTESNDAIWIALIGAIATVAGIALPLFAKFRKLDQANSNQHEANNSAADGRHKEAMDAITDLSKDMKYVSGRLDEHISWHAHQPTQPQVVVTTPPSTVEVVTERTRDANAA